MNQGPTAAGRKAVRHGAVLAVTCLALATVVSAMASLNVAIPDIARETHASQTQLSWIIDAYSLVFAALLLLAATLGDRFGRRRALLGGLALFAGGSAAATFSDDPAVLIALRAVLGVGAAFVMPATLSTITSTFPREQRTRAVSVWAAVAGASAVLGLLASGAVLEVWSWRSVFWLNVLLAVVAFVGTFVFVPESAEPAKQRVDAVGAALTVVGLGILVYSVIEAPEHGWGSARTLAGIALGLVVLAGFVAWELRTAHPLLDPRLFRHRPFAAGTLSITLQFFAFFGFIFVVMQYLQLVRGDSALIAAVSVLPMSAAMIPAARLAPKLAARVGVRRPWIVGLIAVGAGLAVLAELDAGSSYWLILTGLVPLGAGMGLAMTPATAAITDALPSRLQNVGSAVNDLARELGGALGIAVLGSALNAGYRDALDVEGLAEPVAEAARSSLAAANVVGTKTGNTALIDQARDAFASGLHLALLTGAGAAVIAAVCVALLLRRPNRSAGPARESTLSAVGEN
ncbi:MFS transporter [Streptomyces antibioticus]|uniref:Transporter n=1 Tax=Streptomyces antibioticus TaxID=1890 RepID=A0AAE7CP92_STRAT|nr:MFS transporter [Streptomyces antibioticus]MCX4740896.1 MFS transporter [Streptomyces antibioticus]MCX5173700.1 MFS transporter [Streptomyces antibioticus]OOQ48226.1 transporter [Streptomyces antibioticus]QIT48590.1 MFS transporter [Streptomyces antibioticus]